MRRVEQLIELLKQYREHKCSYDEREDGCPVCHDRDQLENEYEYLKDSDVGPEK